MRQLLTKVSSKAFVAPVLARDFRPLHQFFALNRQLAHGNYGSLVYAIDGALGIGVELSNRVYGIAIELYAVGRLVGGREEVEDPTTQTEFTGFGNRLLPHIAVCYQQVDNELGWHVFADAKSQLCGAEQIGRDGSFRKGANRGQYDSRISSRCPIERESTPFKQLSVRRGAVVGIGFDGWNRQSGRIVCESQSRGEELDIRLEVFDLLVR